MTDLQVGWILFLTASAIMFYYSSLENAKSTHYWRGRKDGWDMHRRMTENKRKSDEVFDYEKHN